MAGGSPRLPHSRSGKHRHRTWSTWADCFQAGFKTETKKHEQQDYSKNKSERLVASGVATFPKANVIQMHMLWFEHFLERPSCALNFDFFSSCSFLFPRIAGGPCSSRPSNSLFLCRLVSLLPSSPLQREGAESWLARLYPLSSPTFLPVPFPCQASFFTLPFSLWAGFACRASCYVAPWVWTHLPNNTACEGSALCQIPSPSPYLLRCRVPAGIKYSFLVLCLHIFLSFILYMLQSYTILQTDSRQTLQDKA